MQADNGNIEQKNSTAANKTDKSGEIPEWAAKLKKKYEHCGTQACAGNNANGHSGKKAEVDHTVNVGEGKEAKVVRTKVTAQEKGIAVVADHGKLSKEVKDMAAKRTIFGIGINCVCAYCGDGARKRVKDMAAKRTIFGIGNADAWIPKNVVLSAKKLVFVSNTIISRRSCAEKCKKTSQGNKD
eukprot:CAMPEP_0170173336 /NCGR_PEP_ID=MMETSP0040_2-20121228/6608_1 /TAXON_ID=641309 /ORGANISM="Lotharella oceanica, Strain CCMP622" /LENGTH=183 /DNA_ID=CAMNT_0010414465 /DNA_START=223 /DNA_END=775 /DNA_ORIENTATION=-